MGPSLAAPRTQARGLCHPEGWWREEPGGKTNAQRTRRKTAAAEEAIAGRLPLPAAAVVPSLLARLARLNPRLDTASAPCAAGRPGTIEGRVAPTLRRHWTLQADVRRRTIFWASTPQHAGAAAAIMASFRSFPRRAVARGYEQVDGRHRWVGEKVLRAPAASSHDYCTTKTRRRNRSLQLPFHYGKPNIKAEQQGRSDCQWNDRWNFKQLIDDILKNGRLWTVLPGASGSVLDWQHGP